jgi:hypothetical protein
MSGRCTIASVARLTVPLLMLLGAAVLVWSALPLGARDDVAAALDPRGSDQRALRLEDVPPGMVLGGDSYRTADHPDPRARLPLGARDLYMVVFDALRADGTCCETSVISQVARFDSDAHAALFVPTPAGPGTRVVGRDAIVVTSADMPWQTTVALRAGPIAHFVTVRSSALTLDQVRDLAIRLAERQVQR